MTSKNTQHPDKNMASEAIEPEPVTQETSGDQFQAEKKAWKEQERRERHKHGANFTGGIVLIFLGLTLLLMNFGLISPLFWSYIWQYWPVFFILLGIRLLVGKGWAADFVMLVFTIIIFLIVWNKALIDSDSPLLYHWNLTTLPWYGLLKSLPPYLTGGL